MYVRMWRRAKPSPFILPPVEEKEIQRVGNRRRVYGISGVGWRRWKGVRYCRCSPLTGIRGVGLRPLALRGRGCLAGMGDVSRQGVGLV